MRTRRRRGSRARDRDAPIVGGGGVGVLYGVAVGSQYQQQSKWRRERRNCLPNFVKLVSSPLALYTQKLLESSRAMTQAYDAFLDPSLLAPSEASTPSALSLAPGQIEEREDSPEADAQEPDETEVRTDLIDALPSPLRGRLRI